MHKEMNRWLGRAWRFLRQLFELIRNFMEAPRDSWRDAKPADVLFFSGDIDRSVILDGKAFGRVMDPFRSLFEDAGYSTLSISYPGGRIVGRLSVASTLSFSRLNTAAMIAARLRKTCGQILGITDFTAPPPREQAYFELFQRLRPKVVFGLNTAPDMCSVAGQLKIPVLEVLHARGYGEGNFYRGFQSRGIAHRPDGVVAYDGVSAQTFRRLFPVLQVSNFRLSFELDLARRFTEDQPPPFAGFLNEVRHVILFTASYKHDDSSWPGGLPAELVDIVRQDQSLFLLVRLHPAMLVGSKFSEARKTVNELVEGCTNCDIQWASTAPIYSVLDVSTVHVTFNSMSAYEAADVGLRTYMIDELPDSKMEDLRESGFLVPIDKDGNRLERVVRDSATRLAPRKSEEIESVSEIMVFAKSSSQMRWSQINRH